MTVHSVRVRCRDCRRRTTITAGTTRWCDVCGGELVKIDYNRSTRKKRTK